MSVIDAIAKIITALSPFAWPLVTLLIAMAFRKELTGILSRLKKAKLPGGGEMEFERLLQEAEEDSSAPPDAGGPTALPPAEDDGEVLALGEQSPTSGQQDYRQLARTSPEAAVVLAFRDLEATLQRATKSDGFIPVTKVADTLRKQGRLGRSDEALLRDITRLRNEVTHKGVPDLTYGNVIRYLNLVDGLLQKVEPREITIRDNAVVAGAFPPGGPWRRTGHPPLADGRHRIVRYADGTWRLEEDPQSVVFEPVRPRGPGR